MAQYSKEGLVQKLDKLVGSSESIQVTSYWLLFHKAHAANSINIWQQELAKGMT